MRENGPLWESALHEAAHAVVALALGDRIESVQINARGGGLTERIPRPSATGAVSRPWDPRITNACAIDLAGAIAACRHLGEPEPETRADFERHGGGSDFQNFRTRLDLVGVKGEGEIDRIRRWASAIAERHIRENWDAIVEVARDLIRGGGFLLEGNILAALARTGRGLLQRPATAHAADPPARAYDLAGGTVFETRSGFVAMRGPGCAGHFAKSRRGAEGPCMTTRAPWLYCPGWLDRWRAPATPVRTLLALGWLPPSPAPRWWTPARWLRRLRARLRPGG